MYSAPGGRKSVDSLASPLSPSFRGDFPFHKTGHNPSQRRGSVASSIHSIGGTLDTSSSSWYHAVLESDQNAISTLLQPPIVRTGLVPHTTAPASSGHRPPTAKDIPPVILTNIPIVDSSEFKSYVSQVGSLYDQLQRAKETEEEAHHAQTHHHRPRSRHGDDDTHLRPNSRPGSSSSRKSSLASITGLGEGPLGGHRRGSHGHGRRPTHGPAPLSTIPTVYFDDDFHLENPRTFDVVSERSEVVRPPPGTAEDKAGENGGVVAPRKALATNAILQEKLSWYMDTVEMHLINSISTASTTFFSALGSLRELHSEAAESVTKIKVLRKELEALDVEIATRGMDLVQKRRRRENLQQLDDAVSQLERIVKGVASCEDLVDSGNIEAALDSIDTLEMLIMGEEDPSAPPPTPPKDEPKIRLRDLSGATALQGVNADLDTLRFRIGKAYEQRFVTILLQDLRRHVESVSTQEILLRWGGAYTRARGAHLKREPSGFPTYASNTTELRKELVPVLAGLHRARHLSTAAAVFREAVQREVRNIVRRPLPSSSDDDGESMMSTSTVGAGRQRSQQEKSSVLARNLRNLEPEDAEELLTKIYIGVAETLRRLTTQVKVLLDVTSSAGNVSDGGPDPSLLLSPMKSPALRSPMRSPMVPMDGVMTHDSAAMEMLAEIQRALDMTSLLGQAVDVAQDKIVKVLKVRAAQSSGLSLVWFLRYFTLNLYFSNECEAISGRGGATLKNVVNGHIKEFVQRHGDMEKQKLAQGMESDTWNAKDFGEGEQELLGRVLGASERDARTWTKTGDIWVPYCEGDEEGGAEGETNGNGNGTTNTTTAAATTTSTTATKARTALINEESFMLPHSAILCLEGINQFLHLSAAIPSMTSDIAASLIAYLHLFNSRCQQLILGAGATRSAGLRNITTKHLALASQSVHFVEMLIPYLREFVRRHVGGAAGPTGPEAAGLMAEFDKIRRTYLEHQRNVEGKLVDIMAGRAGSHGKVVRELDWDALGGGGGGGGGGTGGVSAYAETVVKETATLHRVLTKHLPVHVVRGIMESVFVKYREGFGGAYGEAEGVGTRAGKMRMLKDIEFIQSKLGRIDGFDDTGRFLAGVVEAREVRDVQASTTAAATSVSTPSTAGATTASVGAAGGPTAPSTPPPNGDGGVEAG